MNVRQFTKRKTATLCGCLMIVVLCAVNTSAWGQVNRADRLRGLVKEKIRDRLENGQSDVRQRLETLKPRENVHIDNGATVLKPDRLDIGQIVPSLRPMGPQTANFVALYLYYLERALDGRQDTMLDRTMRQAVNDAPADVKQAYRNALARYNTLSRDQKVRLGISRTLLQRLEDARAPLTANELRSLSRTIFASARLGTRPNVNVPRFKRSGARTSSADDDTPDYWAMKLHWTSLKCHDETDYLGIEEGSDEPLAIFAILDSKFSFTFDVSRLSEECRGELVKAWLDNKLADAFDENSDVFSSDRIREEFLEVFEASAQHLEYDFEDYWIRRTKEFSGVDDGDFRSGNVLLVPERAYQGWHTLEQARAVQEHGLKLRIVIPGRTVVSLLFEVDGMGADKLMKIVDGKVKSLTEFAEDLYDLGEIGPHDGMSFIRLAGAIAGLVDEVLGFVIDLVIDAIDPDLIGSDFMVFTGQGYLVGHNSSVSNLTQPVDGSKTIARRGMFRGEDSDYQLNYTLQLKHSALEYFEVSGSPKVQYVAYRTGTPRKCLVGLCRFDLAAGGGGARVVSAKAGLVDGNGQTLTTPKDIHALSELYRFDELVPVTASKFSSASVGLWLKVKPAGASDDLVIDVFRRLPFEKEKIMDDLIEPGSGPDDGGNYVDP